MPWMPDASWMPDSPWMPDSLWMPVDASYADSHTDAHGHDGPPGTIPYDGGTGQNSWWKDTDGVAPELAGCHVEYTESTCGTPSNPGRNFGESCSGNTLIETNPGAGVCHQHDGDLGHPYTVPCNDWCKNQYAIPVPGVQGGQRRGVAAKSGYCVAIGYLPCQDGFVDSARCRCDDEGIYDGPGYPAEPVFVPPPPHGTQPKDSGGTPIPGWQGQKILPTPTSGGQWWVDTDGVAPETPGCHYAYKLEEECIEREPTDEVIGWIGEACEGNILIETNPGAGVCHYHNNAYGHPDKFDCDAYCTGYSWHWGRCVSVPNVCDGPNGASTLASAKCECGFGNPPN
jgi:hypothetical protein